MTSLQVEFYEKLNERYPMLRRGVEDARAVAPELVSFHFERCLEWHVNAHGRSIIDNIVEGYAIFTMEVNIAQQAYEKRGHYEFSTFADADARVYQQAHYMRNYYCGVFAILFCWSHYVELMDFYLSRFLPNLEDGRLIEIAPGHGAWGILAVSLNKGMTLEGFDVSPASLEFAPKLAAGAGVDDRCVYNLKDATKISYAGNMYDGAICSFMLEHLEAPGKFLEDFSLCMRPGSLAYITLALTAAQTDHIYEFKQESEGILMAEAAGFELLEAKITRPSRVVSSAKYIPRVQAMILKKV